MARVKRNVVVCNLCGSEQIERVKGDLEVLGLSVKSAFYAGETGGGPVPKDTFICNGCIRDERKLDELVALVFKDWQDEDRP